MIVVCGISRQKIRVGNVGERSATFVCIVNNRLIYSRCYMEGKRGLLIKTGYKRLIRNCLELQRGQEI